MRLSPMAACVAALAVVTAGCASAGASGPGSVQGAPVVVPADAVAFVGVSTDLASAGHGLAALLLKQTAGWASSMQDAAFGGNEIDVAVLPGDKIFALVQPTDEGKLAAFAKTHNLKVRALDNWTAVAADDATLDAVASAKSHLSDSARFVEAMDRLPASALVRAYANGDTAGKLFASIPGQLESRLIPQGARYRLKPDKPGLRTAVGVGTERFRWIVAALTSTSGGLKLQAFAPTDGLTASGPPRYAVAPIAPYTSALADEIPAGVLAVVDFQVPQGAFELLPQLPSALKNLFGANAVALPNELDGVFGGETAVYVRPALPMPEITFVTQPADTAAASSTLNDLLKSAPKGSTLTNLTLYRAVIGGQFVVSTTQKGIDDFRGGGPKLSADPGFVAAAKEAGMPVQTTGFAYVNVKDVLPLLALAGAKLPAGLTKVGGLVAFGGQTERESTFTAIVDISSS
jgi:hypothetical protein